MVKDYVPRVHFYDQDFVDMYDRTWVWIEEGWKENHRSEPFPQGFLQGPEENRISLFDCSLESLSLCYSNQKFDPCPQIDYFYAVQGSDGRISEKYDTLTNQPVADDPDNPLGASLPLLPYVEYVFYHKIGNKKRLKDVVEHLEKQINWLSANFQKPNGLFSVPYSACHLGNVDRQGAVYTVDFNACMALAALYMSYIGDILNDKELSFRYKRTYFSLKTRINSMMWDTEKQFYFDLDAEGNRITSNKHIGCYWTLLAEIPNFEYADYLVAQLRDPAEFGTDNPFPVLPVSNPCFSAAGDGYNGGVVPFYTYVVVKGLVKYNNFVFARECAIRHMYFILDTLHPDGETVGEVWEAYKPSSEGPSVSASGWVNRRRHLPMLALATIGLMVENIVGLEISLPRKTVDWLMPSLEAMGIENLSLKRNYITILSNKNLRGWEIRLESEKLYYFTIEIIDEGKKKTLPIPSGKCSMLIDKL